MSVSFLRRLFAAYRSLWQEKAERADEPQTPLFRVLCEQIARDGPMSVEAFMQIVLHDSEHGYYRRGTPIGWVGDFSTAPEHSQMFGEMIGVWCFEMWMALGQPDPFILLELGPGRGTLMKSLLTGTSARHDFHRAMRVCLLESSASLRKMQNERLTGLSFTHLESLDALPALPLLVIGNEFFDTFPMRQYVWRKGFWHERLVTLDKGQLAFMEGEALSVPPVNAPQGKLKNGWLYEVSPRSLAMVDGLTSHMKIYGGAGLLIDYGYETPTGQDTLFALRRHKYTSVFSMPGRTDVTGDVDFTAFRRTVESHGAAAFGPVGQGDFLQALGIGIRAAQLHKLSPEFAPLIETELYRLLHPNVMGTWFKVFGFAANKTLPFSGFRSDEGQPEADRKGLVWKRWFRADPAKGESAR